MVLVVGDSTVEIERSQPSTFGLAWQTIISPPKFQSVMKSERTIFLGSFAPFYKWLYAKLHLHPKCCSFAGKGQKPASAVKIMCKKDITL